MEELKKLSREMNSQNNRMTQYPLFVIQHDIYRIANEYEDYDKIEFSEDWQGSFCGAWCEDCQKLIDKADEEDEYADPDKLCTDCQEEVGGKLKLDSKFDLRAGVFFTAKACDEHIAQNNYHYENPRSYGVGAWRNPEMQNVMRHIADMDTGERASFYD